MRSDLYFTPEASDARSDGKLVKEGQQSSGKTSYYEVTFFIGGIAGVSRMVLKNVR